MKRNKQSRRDKITLLKSIAGGTVSKEDVINSGGAETEIEVILDCNDGTGDYYVDGTDKSYTGAEVQSWRDNSQPGHILIEL